jgi:peroxiredoxin
MQDVPRRTAFLIDREGRIRGAWSYGNEVVPDFDELLAAARAL